MNFERFENWIKKNGYTSIFLFVLFFTGSIFQLTDLYERFQSIFVNNVEPYHVVHIDVGRYYSADTVHEGNWQGNILYTAELSESKATDLAKTLNETPSSIFAFSISGAGSITTGSGEQASVPSSLSGEKPFTVEISLPTTVSQDHFMSDVIVHFPAIDQKTGWNSFLNGSLTASESFFQARVFGRLERRLNNDLPGVVHEYILKSELLDRSRALKTVSMLDGSFDTLRDNESEAFSKKQYCQSLENADALTDSELILDVQRGLTDHGAENVKITGEMNGDTAAAIQRYQLDYGMKITGEPSVSVIRKLCEI